MWYYTRKEKRNIYWNLTQNIIQLMGKFSNMDNKLCIKSNQLNNKLIKGVYL